jgi:hypothetical protein
MIKRADDMPNRDHQHQLRCPECGELFDMRNLESVLEHQHINMPLPEIRYTYARQVRVPRQFSRLRENSN